MAQHTWQIDQMPQQPANGSDWISWLKADRLHVLVQVGFQANDATAQQITREFAAAPDLLAALKDMLAGWRYAREHHGDLYGVGWERCEDAARAAIEKAGG